MPNHIKIDPRYYQLLVQAGLLIWGITYLGFTIPLSHVITAFSVGILAQTSFSKYYGLPCHSPSSLFKNSLSSLNSVMSILLLLHANSWLWIALASLIAISSKFLIRYHNKHIFNPSNIGIVAALLLSGSSWAAPGQWGQALWVTLLLAGSGLILLIGFSRMLTSISFLLVFISLTFLRALWLGDPLVIPIHQLQSGALLIFAFFMLSDPMTSPNTNTGRVIFGTWVGVVSWILQYNFYIPNAFLYTLAASMPLVLFLNKQFQGHHYHWPTLSVRRTSL